MTGVAIGPFSRADVFVESAECLRNQLVKGTVTLWEIGGNHCDKCHDVSVFFTTDFWQRSSDDFEDSDEASCNGAAGTGVGDAHLNE